MARQRTCIPLNVFMNGRLVGRLRRESGGAIDFQYNSSWLAWDNALPVSMSLPLREDRFVGEPVVAASMFRCARQRRYSPASGRTRPCGWL